MDKEYIKFSQITSKEKLSQNTINTILQDKKGFMWFGSQDGLNRYDGYNFRVFKKKVNNSNGISENFISVLFEDSFDNLWIGTYNSGIVNYNCIQDKFIKFKSLEVIKNEYITSITEDNEKNLWISTFYHGIYKLNIEKDLLVKVDLNSIFDVTDSEKFNIMSLYFDLDSNKMILGIWQSGLYMIDLTGNENVIYRKSENVSGSLISNNVICLFKDSKNSLWIGTQDGLSRFSLTDKKFENYCKESGNENSISGNSIRSICEDIEGNIWIGNYGQGLNKYDYKSNDFETFKAETDNNIGFISDIIMSVYADRTGVLWIGTLSDGLLKLDIIRKKFYSIMNNNPLFKFNERNKIRSLYVIDKENILVGTFNDGLYICNKIKGRFDFLKHSKINNESVNHIIHYPDGDFLVANKSFGLSKINLKENKISNFDNILDNEYLILHICLNNSEKEILLIGTENEGLKIFDVQNNVILNNNVFTDLKHFDIKSIFFDSNNNLWIATHLKGLLLVKDISLLQNGECKTEYVTFDFGNTVWTVFEDKEKNIWIGTASNGLNKIEPVSNKIEIFNEENGLTNNCIIGILEDENNSFWISTTSGITKFNKNSKTSRQYDLSDGLNNIEFNEGAHFKYEDGTMYFGGDNGITCFHPDEITDNPFIPNVVITNFEIFNESISGSEDNPYLKHNISFAKEINLTHRESVFSFKFAALIFNNPQKNQYAYKMEGFDKDWTYSGTRRRVTYTNLDHGEYIFKVKGSNNDGVWNEDGTSIKITITPPYWKTWWFKGLSALSLIAATGYSYRQRLEKLEKEAKSQKEFARKLIEVQENQTKRIAHELHNTIAHDVLISKQKAMMALKHKDDIPRLEKALEEISELSSATISEVRNIAYNLHPHQLERLGFTKTIKSIINEVSKSTDLNFVFETDNVDDVISKESEINLFRVVQECISNIIKHSGATEVILQVSKTIENLIVLIVDNGRGFDVNSREFTEARSGYGLSGIVERIKYMNGEIKIDSEIGKGTTLKFIIPINKSYE